MTVYATVTVAIIENDSWQTEKNGSCNDFDENI